MNESTGTAAHESSHIEFDHRGQYLYAQIMGPAISRAEAYEHLSEIMHECAQKRCKLLMVERECEDAELEGDFFDSMGEMIKMNSGTKVAFVNHQIECEDAVHHPVNARPDPHYHYFTDADAAERWLLS